VVLFAALESPLTAWVELSDLRIQLPLIVMLFVALTILVFRMFPDFEEVRDPLAVLGGFAGGIFGIYVEEQFSRSSSAGAGWLRFIRIVVGVLSLAGVYLLLSGLYYALAGGKVGLSTSLLYLARYFFTGLWITFGAPAIFVATSLADQKR
jgi:hypothetical protein